MSTSAIIYIIITVASFLLDNKKKKKQKKDPAKTITKTPKVKLGPIKKQNQKQVTETVHTYQRPQVKKQNYVRQTTRKIVDREQEIYSNSKIIDKDKIVNDIIFSEILSKPKSKR